MLNTMYDHYFGLEDSPFSIAPNPHYLYMSERHREALAHLLYGIRSDGGFILLTGEVGTGKTTVCRCLLEQLPANVDTAFILNPKLTADELLATICDDLGIDYPADATIKVLVDRLSEFLLSSYQADRRTVLIIDEAQNLSVDVLEQLRLLTNLETSERKLLQIILLGQPELLSVLSRPELRQLSQRITARFHLDALDADEVTEYIDHRLTVAGAHRQLFTPASVKRIFKLSQGIPRLINLICDRALLGAYVEGRTQVEPRVVNKAAAEILGDAAEPARRLPFRAAGIAATVALAIAGSGVAYFWYSPGSVADPSPVETGVARIEAVVEPPLANSDAATQQPDDESREQAGEAKQVIASATLPVSSAEPVKTALERVKGYPERLPAFVDLFSLWGTPFDGDEDPCTFATRVGLKCMDKTGSLREIAHLNRPALINLALSDRMEWFTLAGLDGDTAHLMAGEKHFVVARETLLSKWDGKYIMLWQMPPDYLHPVQRGDNGAAVDWLVNQLDVIDDGEGTIRTGQRFDEEVESRVKRFQISVGLTPDGIAGAQTWIHINSHKGEQVPFLAPPGKG